MGGVLLLGGMGTFLLVPSRGLRPPAVGSAGVPWCGGSGHPVLMSLCAASFHRGCCVIFSIPVQRLSSYSNIPLASAAPLEALGLPQTVSLSQTQTQPPSAPAP